MSKTTGRAPTRARLWQRSRILLLAVALLPAGLLLPTAAAYAASPTFLITPTALDFGDVPVGTTSPQQSVTITNNSYAPVVMSGAGGAAGQFGGAQDCEGLTIAPGDSCHMYYQFSPTAVGAATGSTGGNWNGQTFAFTFKGNGVPRFQISPTSFDFGEQTIGVPSPQQLVTITNASDAPVVMSGAGGAAGQFGGSQDCEGLTIAPHGSCHMYYQFTPTALGPVTGTTGGNWNGQAFSFSFKGTGVPLLYSFSPTSLDFGNVLAGSTSPPQTVTVTNVSVTPLVVDGLGWDGHEFGGAQDCKGTTLGVGDSCHMTYAFTPTAKGADARTVTGSWNGQRYSIALSGNGLPRPQAITFTSHPPAHPRTGHTYLVAAHGGGSGNPVTFRVGAATTGAACSISGRKVSFRRPGTCVIEAHQAGNSVYGAAPAATQAVVVHGPSVSAKVTSSTKKTAFGWYRSPVTITFHCTAHGSALTKPCPGKIVLTHNGAKQSVTRTVRSKNGAATTIKVSGINIDRTDPRLKIAGVKNGHSYKHTPHPQCVAHDPLSGIASCHGTTHRSTHAGQTAVTYHATAVDRAGNVTTRSDHYIIKTT